MLAASQLFFRPIGVCGDTGACGCVCSRVGSFGSFVGAGEVSNGKIRSDELLFTLAKATLSSKKLNAFWPQNYITDPAQGTLTLDQMVVATQRVGCIR